MRGVVAIRLPMELKLGSLSSDNYHPVIKNFPLHALSPVPTKCTGNLVPRVLFYPSRQREEDSGNEVDVPATDILNNRAMDKIIKYI